MQRTGKNRQHKNHLLSRVIRVSKSVADDLDLFAAKNEMNTREAIDAICLDFLQASNQIRDICVSRWRASGLAQAATAAAPPWRRGPLSVTAWKRACRVETAAPEPNPDEEIAP